MSTPTSVAVTVRGFSFQRLGFDAFPLYAHYFRDATPEDLTYYGSFPLMMYKKFGYKVVDGYLFVFRYVQEGDRERIDAVGLPIDERGARLDVPTTRRYLREFNRRREGRIVHVHPALAARYGGGELAQDMIAVGTEYVYANEPLSRLEGGEFRNLRKNVNRFASRTPVDIVPYTPSMREDAGRIYARWCETHGAKYESVWDRPLVTNLLDHYGILDHHLFVAVDRASGEKVGLFDAVRIGRQLAIGVLRKLDVRYPNLAEHCQVQLARHLTALGCPFLNDGDDAGGRPGLKELKTRFHPVATFTPVRYRFSAAGRGGAGRSASPA